MPLQLVYVYEANSPIELELASLRIALDECVGDYDSLQYHYSQLGVLDEACTGVSFMSLDSEHLYDNCFYNFPGKIQMCWHGPYIPCC